MGKEGGNEYFQLSFIFTDIAIHQDTQLNETKYSKFFPFPNRDLNLISAGRRFTNKEVRI